MVVGEMKDTPKGTKLSVVTEEGEYEGLVTMIDKKGKISLKNVVSLKSGTKTQMMGIQHFFPGDLVQVKVLQGPKVPNDKNSRTQGKSIFCKHTKPLHLQKSKFLESDQLNLNRQFVRSSGSEPESDTDATGKAEEVSDFDDENAERPGEPKVQNGDGPVRKKLPPYKIYDQISDEFHQAIKTIKAQFIVSVSLEGMNISRHGKLCWLSVALKNEIYLFDCISLGGRLMEEGFQEILESSKILKIIHDCRRPSDMLYHLYQVKLRNIFDTQVADIMVFRARHGGDPPRYVRSLPECLNEHLNMNLDELPLQRVRVSCQETDEGIWAQRPMPRALLMLACKNVSYLRSLRDILTEKMMQDFITGVDVYISSLRALKSEDLKKTETHLVPEQFCSLSSFDNHRRRSSDNKVPRENGFIEESTVKLLDDNVIFSHDSIWHQKTYGKIGQKIDPLKEEKDHHREKVKKEMMRAKEQSILKPTSHVAPKDQTKPAVVGPNSGYAASSDDERITMRPPELYLTSISKKHPARLSDNQQQNLPLAQNGNPQNGLIDNSQREGVFAHTMSGVRTNGVCSPPRGRASLLDYLKQNASGKMKFVPPKDKVGSSDDYSTLSSSAATSSPESQENATTNGCPQLIEDDFDHIPSTETLQRGRKGVYPQNSTANNVHNAEKGHPRFFRPVSPQEACPYIHRPGQEVDFPVTDTMIKNSVPKGIGRGLSIAKML